MDEEQAVGGARAQREALPVGRCKNPFTYCHRGQEKGCTERMFAGRNRKSSCVKSFIVSAK